MKWLLCIAAIIVGIGTLAMQAEASERGQRLTIEQVPEDGNLTYLLIFTDDAPGPKAQWAIDTLAAAGIGDKVRFHHVTRSDPAFERYAAHHQGNLPTVLTIAPDRSQVISTLRGSHMPDDRLEFLDLIQVGTMTEAGMRIGPILPWRRRNHTPDQPEVTPAETPEPVTVTQLPPSPDAALLEELAQLTAAKAEPGGLPVSPLKLGLVSLLGLGAGGVIQRRKE